MITAYQLPALAEQKNVSNDEMQDIIRVLAQAPLLYDDGQHIMAQDYLEGLEIVLMHDTRRAAMELYELGVKACRRFPDSLQYEQLQDVLGLQAELWQEGILTLNDWMNWLKQIGEGQRALPVYDFAAMLGELPEGYMIHDFHDELQYRLEQDVTNAWAKEERKKLYDSLGVR
ncbi:hypothetical protein HUB98_24940 [Paenibacillus barcinonensis]|uniref:Uncharacterized protein n=1 Tax=Paenibacillus barcinonensis TaxID=198119 RepID=A0A2V4VG96_PAEBA|nr:hypothetical protein [Paenibacillus barcinonensis]PYE47758.1 hypothetical protein DFQ00_11157 [Paenibacillus barcinonensis]QKS59125.1 hypothetical protein HUB98_24940 [Paenibacillus barcinonensis]